MEDRFKLIDLTHPLNEKVPTWSGGCGFRLEIKLDYDKGIRVQTVKSHTGVGTHMDAPSHFFQGSWNIGDIPLNDLIGPCCVLDLRKKRAPDLLIEPEDIETFEKQYGIIGERSLVFALTGWGSYWNEPDRYRNIDENGKMHFPGFSEKAAEFLLKRKISGIGIDTLSPDGSNRGFPVHEQILGAKKYILENVANLDQMPAIGAYAVAFPPRICEATESTVRIVGLIPQ